MTTAFSPEEVEEASRNIHFVPDIVIDTVNNLLAKKYCTGIIRISQDEIVEAIKKAAAASGTKPPTNTEIFENGWLDFENVYRGSGWKVVYDKPGYNESYGAFFEFSKKNYPNDA